MAVGNFAVLLREGLKTAGVTRTELFESKDGFRRLVGHDLRASCVTLSRANGVDDETIRRRTGHTTRGMVDRYDHARGIFEELGCGELQPLHEAIPELAALPPSEQWILADDSMPSIVGESSAG